MLKKLNYQWPNFIVYIIKVFVLRIGYIHSFVLYVGEKIWTADKLLHIPGFL